MVVFTDNSGAMGVQGLSGATPANAGQELTMAEKRPVIRPRRRAGPKRASLALASLAVTLLDLVHLLRAAELLEHLA